MANSMDISLKIKEMAQRIRELREIEGYTTEEMAQKTGISPDEYVKCENGEADLNFAFIYRCADALRVNVTDIIEGSSPNLRSYTVTRAGGGQEIAKAHGMVYYNMAHAFRNRIAEPLYVVSTYDEKAQNKDIELTKHEGQECDIVIEGNLMVQIGEHKEVLGPGDSIYYNSDTPHGMIAVNGKDCKFYAIVLRADAEVAETTKEVVPTEQIIGSIHRDTKDRIYHNYIDIVEDE
ncbi:MAG: cupin domain-containing protein [Clostridia bacterium]|nr:cupin domain-containing protein [Clostridia bacterium]